MSLEGCQSARAQAITDALGSKIAAIAGSAIDVAIGSIVEVRRVEGLAAIGAVEATLVPDATLADHLFGGKHSESATWTAARGALSIQGTTIGKLNGGFTTGGHQRGCMSIAKALGAITLAIAGLAIDIAIGAIAGQHRVQWTMAVGAIVALPVPHLALGQLLFGGKDGATATWTSLALGRLDRCRIGIDEGATGANLILGQTIGLQETRAAGKAITMWSPLLAIASVAIDIAIGTIAGIDRIQCLLAVSAIVALLVPLASLGELLLGGKDSATATGTTLARTRPNLIHIDGGPHLRSTLIIGITIRLQGTAALAKAIALGSKLLGIAALAVDVLVGRLTAQHRVETLLAGAALEALLVPAASTCQHLFGGIHIATATRTTLTIWGTSNGPGLHASTVPHRLDAILELCPIVHGECAGAGAKAITLGSVFTSMTDLAEQLTIVLCAVGRVQGFVAHRALEAILVE